MPPFIPGQAFAELYGLTRSELRVLLAMVPGLSVKEAAKCWGSARTRPRPTCNTFTEDRTSKQTELMFVHEFHTASPPARPLVKYWLMSPFNS